MANTVNLTLKIEPELKEIIKNLALSNHHSISDEVCQRLQASLTELPPMVDSQHTQEEATPQLTDSELKQIRSLLKKEKKKK